MQNFSKYFNLDIIDTNQTLKPVLLITEPTDNSVLFTLTLDEDELLDNNENVINTITAIQKVSNVKVSNDYDSKKLKINTLRCTLYNYYDSATRLSKHINTGIINKNLYLFYKSPTTNVINLTDTISDYDCALVYRGEISRIKFNDKTLEITAEDRTQIKIADKTVPYMSIDKLNTDISENIVSHYKNDDTVVPMTFGKVDKAPVLPYYEDNNDRIMNLLLDVQPTTSYYRTFKIPAMDKISEVSAFQWTPFPISDYCIYIKDSDDYLIYDHMPYTLNMQYEPYSKFKVVSVSGFVNNNIVPEIGASEVSQIYKLWDTRAYAQRMVESVYASDGSIMDLVNITSDNFNNLDFINMESINDNGGNEKKWYRTSDNISPSNTNFDTGLKYFNFDDVGGTGRWILLKLDKGHSQNLLNIQQNGEWLGNTFFLSNYRIYQDPAMLNNTSVEMGVAPIVPEIWNELLKTISGHTGNFWTHIKLHLMLLKTTEEIEEAKDILDDDELSEDDKIDQLRDQFSSQFYLNPFRGLNMSLQHHLVSSGLDMYWGINNNMSALSSTFYAKNISGLYYGDDGNQDRQLLEVPANEFDNIAIFEYHINLDGIGGYNTDSNYNQGLQMNNAGFLQSVLVEKVNEKELYTSIVGRKNHMFTEQLNPESFNMFPQVDVPFDYYLAGADNTMPDFDLLIDETYNIIKNTFLEIYPYVEDEVTRDELQSFIFGTDWNDTLQGMWAGNITDDSPLANDFGFFKEYIWNQIMIPAKLYFQWAAELDGAKIVGGYENTSYDGAYDESYIFSDPDYQNSWTDVYDTLDSNDLSRTIKNYRELFTNENWVKCFLTHIFKYLYNTDIDNDRQFLVDYRTVLYGGAYEIEFSPTSTIDIIQSVSNVLYIDNNTININDDVNNLKQYDYNSFGEINTLEDWKNNFYVYMDDLIQSICEPLINQIGLGEHNTSYESFTTNPTDININIDDSPSVTTTIYNDEPNIPISEFAGNMNEWAALNSFVLGLGYNDINLNNLEQLLFSVQYIIEQQLGEEEIVGVVTDGVIQKPSDIIMNILVNEMEFSKYNNENRAGDILFPEYTGFDMDSIELSRQIHNTWKMGFSVNKKTNGKKLIEEILKESKSYPKFTSDGKFSLITIKEQYEYNDIDKIIDESDVIKYTFNQTKREDILTSVKMFYRYDYGHDKYGMSLEKNITDLLPDYNGYNYYNVDDIDTHQDIELKYHTHTNTVDNFADYTLLNSCNPHNEVVLELPLKYMNLTVGDKIYIPLINNEKIFDIDYSKVDILNGQAIYPLWIILATDIGSKSIKIKAYQLHYLGTDGLHGFVFPDQEYEIVGNMKEFNTTYKFINGNYIPNWNYNPNATIDSGVEIPYFDLTGDGQINISDLTLLTSFITGTTQLSNTQKNRLKYNYLGQYSSVDDINTTDVVSLVNLITYNE